VSSSLQSRWKQQQQQQQQQWMHHMMLLVAALTSRYRLDLAHSSARAAAAVSGTAA
jgi:hypothetical protein